jgi:hypothetical protein
VTVIAGNREMVAGDTLVVHNDRLVSTHCKVHVVRDMVVGYVGDMDSGIEFLEWCKRGRGVEGETSLPLPRIHGTRPRRVGDLRVHVSPHPDTYRGKHLGDRVWCAGGVGCDAHGSGPCRSSEDRVRDRPVLRGTDHGREVVCLTV